MRLIGGVVTAILYSAIVFLAVVLLAAVQLRSSGGAAFDTWSVNYEPNEEAYQERTLETEVRLNTNQDDRARNMEQLLFAKSCLQLFDENGIPKAKLIDASKARLEIEEAIKAKVPIDRLSEGAQCLDRGFINLKYYDQPLGERKDKEYSDEKDELKRLLDSDRKEHDELIKGHQDFIAFKKMAEDWYRKPFFYTPYDLLVLLLVMMMGAIGGMVRLLRDYGSSEHPNPSCKDYLVIPLIGAVVAIGGFVLAKTGLMVLSSTKEETSMSPYMISLVGIISGLLAKEVIERIAKSGRSILEPVDDPSNAAPK